MKTIFTLILLALFAASPAFASKSPAPTMTSPTAGKKPSAPNLAGGKKSPSPGMESSSEEADDDCTGDSDCE